MTSPSSNDPSFSDNPAFSDEWRDWRRRVDLDEYESRWDRLAAEGHDAHGEADFIASFTPASVLDAGCGMGRVGIELARRGIDVVGVDLDSALLERAMRAAPDLTWVCSDLSELDLGRSFDVVAFAGNVIGFVQAERRALAVARAAAHLDSGGLLINGYSLWPTSPTIEEYMAYCEAAGLALVEAYASWDRDPLSDADGVSETGPDYCVAVHRRD